MLKKNLKPTNNAIIAIAITIAIIIISSESLDKPNLTHALPHPALPGTVVVVLVVVGVVEVGVSCNIHFPSAHKQFGFQFFL